MREGWLVGFDGGRSTVRKLAGFEFFGCDAEIVSLQALIDMAKPERFLRGGLGGWEMRLGGR